jgi:hypothetical protein
VCTITETNMLCEQALNLRLVQVGIIISCHDGKWKCYLLLHSLAVKVRVWSFFYASNMTTRVVTEVPLYSSPMRAESPSCRMAAGVCVQNSLCSLGGPGGRFAAAVRKKPGQRGPEKLVPSRSYPAPRTREGAAYRSFRGLRA